MSRILISNTGPIIALAGVCSLHLLQELYGQVVVPHAVDNEIRNCAKSKIGLLEYWAAEWIDVQDQCVIDPLLLSSLDFGEASVEITPIRQEQLKERLGERFRELDTPLLVKWSDGRREAVLFVIEEETVPGRFSIHRLAHYCLDLSELMKTDRVVPVVIFLKSGPHPQSLNLGTENATYLNFRYIACALFGIPAEDYLYSDNIVARLNLPNMAYAPKNRLAIYRAAQIGLSTLEPNVNKQRKYIDFIDNYANLSDDEVMQYKEQYFEKESEIMGLAHVLREEGRQEGVNSLISVIHNARKQGLSEDIIARITNLDPALIQKVLNNEKVDIPLHLLNQE